MIPARLVEDENIVVCEEVAHGGHVAPRRGQTRALLR